MKQVCGVVQLLFECFFMTILWDERCGDVCQNFCWNLRLLTNEDTTGALIT